MKSIRTETICIDIDGVIADSKDMAYFSCEPVEDAVKSILVLKEHYLIYLFTGRHINYAEQTKQWLCKYGIYYDHLMFGKPPAVHYIDDKGMEFKSWKQTMESIQKHST